MIRARTHSTGFRFAGTLVLLAMLPSFAPDTWGLSCLHHASHDAAGEHEPETPREGQSAVPEPGHHAIAGADGRGAHEHEPGAMLTHVVRNPDRDSGHHDSQAPPCTCAGECTISAGQAAPAQARTFGLPPAWSESARQSPVSASPAAGRTPYLLPFANAPPLS